MAHFHATIVVNFFSKREKSSTEFNGKISSNFFFFFVLYSVSFVVDQRMYIVENNVGGREKYFSVVVANCGRNRKPEKSNGRSNFTCSTGFDVVRT